MRISPHCCPSMWAVCAGQEEALTFWGGRYGWKVGGTLLFRAGMWGQTETVQHLFRQAPSSAPSKLAFLLPITPSLWPSARVCAPTCIHGSSGPHPLAGGPQLELHMICFAGNTFVLPQPPRCSSTFSTLGETQLPLGQTWLPLHFEPWADLKDKHRTSARS